MNRLKKRIIPCLDVKDERTVKGINFIQLSDAGDPIELAKLYSEQGADELVFLDITATIDKRKTLLQLVDRIAQNINIPFTVGGGIISLEDVSACLEHGADKVVLNTAIVNRPQLVDEVSNFFGNQCIVAAVDTNEIEKNTHRVYTHGGRQPTSLDTLAWVKELESRGVGEVLLTSINHDGTKNGFAYNLYKQVSDILSIPLIASGGAGNEKHFIDVFEKGSVDAALAASVFHFGEINIAHLKNNLKALKIPIR